MRTEPHMKSATIFQFPVGGRAGQKRARTEAVIASIAPPIPMVPRVDIDSWYHQDAIAKDDKPHN